VRARARAESDRDADKNILIRPLTRFIQLSAPNSLKAARRRDLRKSGTILSKEMLVGLQHLSGKTGGDHHAKKGPG